MSLALPDPYIGGDFAEDLTDLPEVEFRKKMKERFDSLQRNFDKLAQQFPVSYSNAAAGTVIEMWKEVTSQTANSTFPNSEWNRDLTAGTGWRVTVNPPVDAWLDIAFRIPEIVNIGGNWLYSQVLILLIAGDNLVASDAQGAVTAGSGGYVGESIMESYGAAAVQYGTIDARTRLELIGGNTYTFCTQGWQEGAGPVMLCTDPGRRPYFEYTLYTRDS